ncbi:MAG TPA: universal stress protein [Bacteroidia bacterium]|nr:universal stress protein [Bacteroidia bacterium]
MEPDYSKLKKRPAFPFETVAVAIAFSPRLEAILMETKRMVNMFGGQLVIIHVGKKDPHHEEVLDKLLNKIGFTKIKYRIIWMEGEPIDTILKLCKLYIVDLLILGALEKENLYKYYVGSIARTISRRAKCSVLLLTNPSINPKKMRKIVVNGIDNPKTIHTLKTTHYLAKHEKVSEFTVVQEVSTPMLSMTIAESGTEPEVSKIKKEMQEEDYSKLNALINSIENDHVNIELKIVQGKPGYAISNFARQNHYDLIVFNSPDTHLGIFDRIFTHDIEYVLADMPCNLLIVHSRV